MRRQKNCVRAISAILLFTCLVATPYDVIADVYFGHDLGTIGVPPLPANGIFAVPDVADLFFTNIVVNTTPGPNLGNILVGNNPPLMGLLPGDNIDAIHMELRPLGDPSTGDIAFSPAFTFSPDQGTAGLPGTPVNLQAPLNSGDFFQWTNFGQHVLSLNENQVGLAPAISEDVDSFLLTPFTVGTPPNSNLIFFSLTPGSPTLALLGASAADILAAPVGGPAYVVITANQLGLATSDDIDGLVMLAGVDADGDGFFNSISDTFPWVNFSVSGGSQGLPGTAVANQVATDPPVGGDIYFSLGGNVNALAFDDGAFGLGLADTDNLNGLDMPELAIFPGLPGSTPFTAGPWGSGGGPPIFPPPPPPPPPPGGGGGGCVNAVRFSVCAGGPGSVKITLDGRISCNGGAVMQAGNSPQCVRVPCNDANAIVQAMMTALGAMTGPGGVPIFGGSVVGGNNGMARGTINVNPGFAATGCKLVTISVRWSNTCITISMALLSIAIDLPVDNFTVIEGEKTEGGEYMIQLSENEAKIIIPFTPGSTAEDAVKQVVDGLTAEGFVVESSGNQFSIISKPDGGQLTDFYAFGLVDSDFTDAEFSYAWPYVPACKQDLDGDRKVDDKDLSILRSRFGAVTEGREEPADFNHDGFVDKLDTQILIENQGDCPEPIDVHSKPIGLSGKDLELPRY